MACRKEGGSFLLLKNTIKSDPLEKKKIEKRESWRERLHLLSRFSDDRTIGLRRNTKGSPSY